MMTSEYRNRIKELWPKLQANNLEAKQELAVLLKERRETKLCDCGCGRPLLKIRIRAAKYKKCQNAGRFFSALCYQIWRRSKFLGAAGAALLLLFAPSSMLFAASATLGWNPTVGAKSYNIYYGGKSGNYTNKVSGILTASITLAGLMGADTYYFAATTVNTAGIESLLSKEISYLIPSSSVVPSQQPTLTSPKYSNGRYSFAVSGVSGQKYAVESSRNLSLWTRQTTNTAPFTFVDTNASQYNQRFYRAVYLP
jgi:hypothetical protein